MGDHRPHFVHKGVVISQKRLTRGDSKPQRRNGSLHPNTFTHTRPSRPPTSERPLGQAKRGPLPAVGCGLGFLGQGDSVGRLGAGAQVGGGRVGDKGRGASVRHRSPLGPEPQQLQPTPFQAHGLQHCPRLLGLSPGLRRESWPLRAARELVSRGTRGHGREEEAGWEVKAKPTVLKGSEDQAARVGLSALAARPALAACPALAARRHAHSRAYSGAGGPQERCALLFKIVVGTVWTFPEDAWRIRG